MMTIRDICKNDSLIIKTIIEEVMPEFDAQGSGFAIHDPEVQDMFLFYQKEDWKYLVVEINEEVVGGAGFSPLPGGEDRQCELKKMYVKSDARGLGIGQKLIERCEKLAYEAGFFSMYIETLERMKRANLLYQKNGYEELSGPLGSTGHFGCDTWYLKKLSKIGAK